MPKDWKAALQGAQKLGLVRIQGGIVQLTPVGEAAKQILPDNLRAWAEVHQRVGTKSGKKTLAQYYPREAALLRLLLLEDKIVRLIIEGLEKSPDHTATFAGLALACDQLDHALAPIFFLLPEAVAELQDNRGRIQWEKAEEKHYRSRSYYQFKSILKHAGILKPTSLGADSSNIWALMV